MSVVIENLHKRFGAVAALDGISLEVSPGETFGLIGPDGAGKTTLMRILCGLMKPDEGRFSVLGNDGLLQMRHIKSEIGYMPQRFSLYPDLTVDENLKFFADLFGVFGEQRSRRKARLLEFSRLGPFSRRRASALSGGMKQKLALSCALIHTPKMLILDEPTTGVDPVSRREFWAILSDLSREEKTTILISTPYMDEAEKCGRIAFLNKGAILSQGTPAEILSAYPYQIIEFSLPHLPSGLHVFDELSGVRSARILGDRARLSIDTDDLEKLKKELTYLGYANIQIETKQPAIEDTFVYLLQGDVLNEQPR